jgi:hypothetical protein
MKSQYNKHCNLKTYGHYNKYVSNKTKIIALHSTAPGNKLLYLHQSYEKSRMCYWSFSTIVLNVSQILKAEMFTKLSDTKDSTCWLSLCVWISFLLQEFNSWRSIHVFQLSWTPLSILLSSLPLIRFWVSREIHVSCFCFTGSFNYCL